MKQIFSALLASILLLSSNSFGQVSSTQANIMISKYLESTLPDSSIHHPITLDNFYYDEIVIPDSSTITGRNDNIVRRNYNVNFNPIDGTWLNVEGGKLCLLFFQIGNAKSVQITLENVKVSGNGGIWAVRRKAQSDQSTLLTKNIQPITQDTILGFIGNEAIIAVLESNDYREGTNFSVPRITADYSCSEMSLQDRATQ